MVRLDILHRSVLAAVLGLGLASGSLSSKAQALPAGPALWIVRDADSTIYLFGTIHFLRPDADWRTDRVERALNASGVLVLEVANPDDRAAAVPLIQQYGLSPDRPLSSILQPDDLQRLGVVAASIGADARQMDMMRPWLAGVMLSSAGLARAGYGPQSGVDVALRSMAQQAGKQIVGLETAEDQVRMLSGFPEDGQIAFLNSTLSAFDDAPIELERLASAWSAGDTDAIARITLDPMKKRSERLYQTLIVDRNGRWARQIVDMLKGAGTTFVAVGALHLSGDDGLPAILQADGIEVSIAPD